MPFKNILQRRVSGPGAYGNNWRRYVQSIIILSSSVMVLGPLFFCYIRPLFRYLRCFTPPFRLRNQQFCVPVLVANTVISSYFQYNLIWLIPSTLPYVTVTRAPHFGVYVRTRITIPATEFVLMILISIDWSSYCASTTIWFMSYSIHLVNSVNTNQSPYGHLCCNQIDGTAGWKEWKNIQNTKIKIYGKTEVDARARYPA